jgi:3-deoxy-D-manno-octulosonic-acid transferase
MKLLIVSDAWFPQTNGVVRTLEETARELERMGHTVKIVGPEKSWRTFAAPTYPEIKLEFFAHKRLKAVLDEFQPDYVHISTEGPLGVAMRRVCLTNKRPFSSAYHTCFPEYFEKRVPAFMGPTVRAATYQLIKLFHAPSGAVMVTTPTMESLLRKRRIKRMRRWSRGVDTSLFCPFEGTVEAYAALPRPIFLYVGRIAVEKNLEAFLDLDLPGSKVLIGDGPHVAQFREKYKSAVFLGKKKGEDLARHYAGADAFVFPSKTDTFGLVLLEALACGLAIAAYPVQGPRDVFADRERSAPYVALEDDLKTAALKAAALKFDKAQAHDFVAQNFSWAACTAQFLSNLQAPTPMARRRVSRYRWTLNLLEILWRRLRTTPKFLPHLYRTASMLLSPLMPAYLSWRAGRGKEDVARIEERLGGAGLARPSGKLIWCHAASVGESLSLLPLLERLKTLESKPTILLTSGTRTSAEILARRLPEGIIHQYVPVDTYQATQRFIEHWHPDLALITESELWPNLLEKIRKFDIPAALINGRMSARSAERWLAFANLWIARLLGVFDITLAQSEVDAQRLKTLGAYQAHSVGNLKAAAGPLPYDETALEKMKTAIGARPVWLMASSHEGEEEIASTVHARLIAEFPDLLTIIAPRHPARAARIKSMLEGRKLSAVLRSSGQNVTPANAFYIADTLGEMGLFYRLSPIVCMGGSFVQAGGHNPLEPAQFGDAIFFGPDMRNTAETASALLKEEACLQVEDAGALEKALSHLLKNPDQAQLMGQKAREYAAAQKEVIDRVMLELQPLLDKTLNRTSC